MAVFHYPEFIEEQAATTDSFKFPTWQHYLYYKADGDSNEIIENKRVKAKLYSNQLFCVRCGLLGHTALQIKHKLIALLVKSSVCIAYSTTALEYT